jgi:predicted membrane protein
VAGLLIGLGLRETYQWACPGSIDNFCSEARAVYFGMLLPPMIASVAYALTGLIVGAVLGPLVATGLRSIREHRRDFYAIGLGALLGTLLFLVRQRV